MKAKLIGQDDWGRDIYKSDKGALFVMVQGSLYNKPTLYTLGGDGEPEYPIKINGVPVTADMIEEY